MRNVRMSVASRIARRFLSLPESVLGPLAGRGRIVRDGRVLNRRIQVVLALGERVGRTRLKCDPAAARKELKQVARIGMPIITSVHVVDRHIPGPGGELPIRVYRRFGAAAAPPAIVYLHGGGWVAGDLDTHDGTCRLLADVSGCVVVAVDYRRAPEHPFPAAIDDAVAAYIWVQRHPGELSIAPGRVGVMGDSAGGNLSAALALEVRGLSVLPPVAQGLVYPAVDLDTLRFPSHQSVGSGFGLERAAIEWFRSQYLPSPDDRRSPRVSPLLASDLTGAAPALVVTAGFDPLRDEGKAYADALAAAGVPVRYRCYDDMIHGFFGFGILPEGMAIATEVCQAMGDLMQASR
jgi:acetyl esterase